MTQIPDNSGFPILDTAVITLTFPCVAEYVSIARLAILGIASRLPLSYDEVEDVRLAVGEACTHAVERSSRAPGRAPTNAGHGSISIESRLQVSLLTIEVVDDIPSLPPGVEDSFDDDDTDLDRSGLGALLMEILVDSVKIESGPTGTSVRLTKRPTAI